jgi:hypothetical protein
MSMMVAVAGLLSLAALPSGASDGEIDIFGDANATVTNVSIPCGETAMLWVYAFLEGASASGLTSAEYAVEVDGPGGFLFVGEQPNPTADAVDGNAFPPYGGTRVFWDDCQTGKDGMLLLATVTVFNAGCTSGSTGLRVVKHSEPGNPFFQCPNFTLCDIPIYTRVCVGTVTTDTCPFPPYAPACQFSVTGGIRLSTDPVSVEPGHGAGLPTEIVFGRPNPNPSGGHLRFWVGLPESATLSLRIYDLSGRRIAQVDGWYEPGWHALEWDGVRSSAAGLGSGVYFARLLVDGRPVGRRRVVLTR